MARPSLLILDGASLPQPGVEGSLQSSGWDVRLVASHAAVQLLLPTAPSLVLLDPERSGEAGLEAVHSLQARYPGLPVVALKGSAPVSAIPELAGTLDRSVPVSRWGAILNGLLGAARAERNKFTAEDLFADILADLDAPAQPSIPRPAVSPALAESGNPPPAAPIGVEYTLSGISGINDPFGPPATIPAEPLPSLPPVSVGEFVRPEPAPSSRIEFLDPPEANPRDTLPSLPGILGSPAGSPPLPGGMAQARPAPIPVAPIPVAPTPLAPTPVALAPVFALPQPGPPASGARELPPEGALEEFGNYFLLEKVAVGGMAELFKARQRGVHNFEKIVAIKRILPHLSDNDEFVRMFIDEAKLAAQLTHPNIVQIFDLGKAGGFYYIAMEFVDGRDLRSLLRKAREYHMPFPEPVAAYVAMKVAGALDYAHRKTGMNDKELKLVHRDISPQNVLISGEGAVKLVDFGIAKAATKSTQTMAGALKGKLLYMSPEQALAQPLDSRSDIYSLGLVLFELLTCERCFQADSELGVLEKVRLGKVQDIQSVNPVVSKEMVTILDRALHKDVDKRYSSARFLERDLKALLVRRGDEPTEHEVAEFVNTLLKGTLDQLNHLVSLHWPDAGHVQVRETVPVENLAAEGARLDGHPPRPMPLPPSHRDTSGTRRRGCLLYASSGLLVVLAALLWFFAIK